VPLNMCLKGVNPAESVLGNKMFVPFRQVSATCPCAFKHVSERG
jgi:hypothetical protein